MEVFAAGENQKPLAEFAKLLAVANLLLRMITMPENSTITASSQASANLMRMATYASLSVAVTLVVAKLVAWGLSDSMSLLATLIDSTLDVLASAVNLLAVRHALTPADKEHRFGHGKAEALAGLGQAAFVAGSSGFLLLGAVRRLLDPQPIEAFGVGVVVMVFSIIATLGLLAFQRHVVRKTGSTAIGADALHYRTDLLVNVSVIAALLLAARGWTGFDPLFALCIAAYILFSAWEIVRQSLDHLMDRELPDEDRQAIKEIVRAHLAVKGLHDLRTRQAGTDTFIQLHLELDDELTLLQAHHISDEVEGSLQERFADAQIIIHVDPVSIVPLEPVPGFLRQ